jgi:hypothetical protein
MAFFQFSSKGFWNLIESYVDDPLLLGPVLHEVFEINEVIRVGLLLAIILSMFHRIKNIIKSISLHYVNSTIYLLARWLLVILKLLYLSNLVGRAYDSTFSGGLILLILFYYLNVFRILLF